MGRSEGPADGAGGKRQTGWTKDGRGGGTGRARPGERSPGRRTEGHKAATGTVNNPLELDPWEPGALEPESQETSK